MDHFWNLWLDTRGHRRDGVNRKASETSTAVGRANHTINIQPKLRRVYQGSILDALLATAARHLPGEDSRLQPVWPYWMHRIRDDCRRGRHTRPRTVVHQLHELGDCPFEQPRQGSRRAESARLTEAYTDPAVYRGVYVVCYSSHGGSAGACAAFARCVQRPG